MSCEHFEEFEMARWRHLIGEIGEHQITGRSYWDLLAQAFEKVWEHRFEMTILFGVLPQLLWREAARLPAEIKGVFEKLTVLERLFDGVLEIWSHCKKLTPTAPLLIRFIW
jgi:hypothetical protein